MLSFFLTRFLHFKDLHDLYHITQIEKLSQFLQAVCFVSFLLIILTRDLLPVAKEAQSTRKDGTYFAIYHRKM